MQLAEGEGTGMEMAFHLHFFGPGIPNNQFIIHNAQTREKLNLQITGEMDNPTPNNPLVSTATQQPDSFHIPTVPDLWIPWLVPLACPQRFLEGLSTSFTRFIDLILMYLPFTETQGMDTSILIFEVRQ